MFEKVRENSVRPTLECGPGRTKQNMQSETDINLIMSKYQKTGTVNFVSKNKAQYLDVPNIDYHEALNTIKEAENMFSEMPSSLRKRFKNDPGEFLDFMHTEGNQEEIYDLGLADRPIIDPGDIVIPPAAEEDSTAT